MLKLLPLLRMAFARRRLRLLFTVASIVVAFLLFGLLSAVGRAFTTGVQVAGQDRMIVTHKTSIIMSLPRSYLGRVRQLPEVRSASSLSWVGGWYQDPKNQLPAFAIDDSYFDIYPEVHVAAAELADWRDDRAAAIACSGVASEYGWRVGDQVPLRSNIFRKKDGSSEWPVRIAGICHSDVVDPRTILIHYDYLNESRSFGRDEIGWIILSLHSPALGPGLALELDGLFANSPAETKTATEKALAQSFANQVGDIGAILRFVISAVFFAMLLVTANTMAQSVRERTSELAVLKTLGFTDRTVLILVLAESIVIALAGGLSGLGLAALAAVGIGAKLKQYLPSFALTAQAAAVGVLFMLLLGLAAGALPAWSAMRLKIADALRRG